VDRLLGATAIDEADPARFVAAEGRIVATFDRTQDSGNISWLVETGNLRFFVKSAGSAEPPARGEPHPYFDHAGRVALLRNAVEVARSCAHPAFPALRNVIETPAGPLLVYDAVPGELIHGTRSQRADPASAYQRLAAAPAGVRLTAFDQVVDAHVALAAAGWVACDLYDGCLLVDLADGRLWLIDLDTYRRGPSTNDMGRMFGSSTFMAPEEHELGAPIDERTTVFTLGRLLWHFGTGLSERPEDFCGTAAAAEVVRSATHPDRGDRPADVATFASAWSIARAQ
jgi:serine/threonine-protein kinase